MRKKKWPLELDPLLKRVANNVQFPKPYVANDVGEVSHLGNAADNQVNLEVGLASVTESDFEVVGLTADEIGGH